MIDHMHKLLFIFVLFFFSCDGTNSGWWSTGVCEINYEKSVSSKEFCYGEYRCDYGNENIIKYDHVCICDEFCLCFTNDLMFLQQSQFCLLTDFERSQYSKQISTESEKLIDKKYWIFGTRKK